MNDLSNMSNSTFHTPTWAFWNGYEQGLKELGLNDEQIIAELEHKQLKNNIQKDQIHNLARQMARTNDLLTVPNDNVLPPKKFYLTFKNVVARSNLPLPLLTCKKVKNSYIVTAKLEEDQATVEITDVSNEFACDFLAHNLWSDLLSNRSRRLLKLIKEEKPDSILDTLAKCNCDATLYNGVITLENGNQYDLT